MLAGLRAKPLGRPRRSPDDIHVDVADPSNLPDAAQLKSMIARFAPTPLEVNVTGLSAGDRKALGKLIQASRLINRRATGRRAE